MPARRTTVVGGVNEFTGFITDVWNNALPGARKARVLPQLDEPLRDARQVSKPCGVMRVGHRRRARFSRDPDSRTDSVRTPHRKSCVAPFKVLCGLAKVCRLRARSRTRPTQQSHSIAL